MVSSNLWGFVYFLLLLVIGKLGETTVSVIVKSVFSLLLVKDHLKMSTSIFLSCFLRIHPRFEPLYSPISLRGTYSC